MNKTSSVLILSVFLFSLFAGVVSACHCGDGWVYTPNGEQCDLGLNNGKVCTPLYGSSCTYCSSQCKNITIQGGYCGDGIKQANEGCDDGNLLSNDGCSSTCKLETCGDGIIQSSEECDLGTQNGVSGSGCSANCTTEKPPAVPEFGTIIGMLTALSALGIFFVVRRSR